MDGAPATRGELSSVATRQLSPIKPTEMEIYGHKQKSPLISALRKRIDLFLNFRNIHELQKHKTSRNRACISLYTL